MNKYELINSINEKAKNGRTLQSLAFSLVHDSANAKNDGDVTYSPAGYFVTEMPGHLMSYRISKTKNPNIFRLYVGNIYPSEYELDKFESSGLTLSDEQKDREEEFATSNYNDLTDEEIAFLSEKVEVYTHIDLKTAEFLKTRTKEDKIVISGRYDFSKNIYSTKKPSKRSEGNPYWDKISINIQSPHFSQVKLGEPILDITNTVETAAFKIEAEKLAETLNTSLKGNVNISNNKYIAFFEDGSYFKKENGFASLNKGKEQISFDTSKIGVSLDEYKGNLKDSKKDGFLLNIPKNSHEGILLFVSTETGRKKFLNKVEHEGSTFFTEYCGKIDFERFVDGKTKKYPQTSISGNGAAVRVEDNNYVATLSYDLDKINEVNDKFYLNAKKTHTGVFVFEAK